MSPPVRKSEPPLIFLVHPLFLRAKTVGLKRCIYIATDYVLEGKGSIPGKGEIFYSLHVPFQASYPLGIWVYFVGVKRPVCETDHSLSSTAKVRKGGDKLSLPHTS
jgi:hypothetical protein